MRRVGLLAVLLIFAACREARGDEEVSPRPYLVTAGDGTVYFRMMPVADSPYDPQLVQGSGQAFRVGAEKDEPLWSTSGWYAFRVLLSDDGRYLVRIGNWPRGHAPSEGHLAVAFYDGGKLLKSYSTKELIQDTAKVHPSVSHYMFLAGTPEFAEPYGTTFRLVTADSLEYVFDVQTGAIQERHKLVAAP